MRLVDADALPIVARGKNHHRKYVFADITDAPTIPAIPVEWLEEQAKDNYDYSGTLFRVAIKNEPIPADIAEKLGIEPKEG